MFHKSEEKLKENLRHFDFSFPLQLHVQKVKKENKKREEGGKQGSIFRGGRAEKGKHEGKFFVFLRPRSRKFSFSLKFLCHEIEVEGELNRHEHEKGMMWGWTADGSNGCANIDLSETNFVFFVLSRF